MEHRARYNDYLPLPNFQSYLRTFVRRCRGDVWGVKMVHFFDDHAITIGSGGNVFIIIIICAAACKQCRHRLIPEIISRVIVIYKKDYRGIAPHQPLSLSFHCGLVSGISSTARIQLNALLQSP
jgi:hypothetical protein